MMERVQVVALSITLLIWNTIAFAQTSPGTPAAPGAGTAPATDTAAASGVNWLWILIVIAIIAAAIWYFMRGRRTSL